MRYTSFWILQAIFFLPFCLAAQQPTAQEILENSIRYHDPLRQWGTQLLRLFLTETRPGEQNRQTTLEIDLPNNRFVIEQLRGDDRTIRWLQQDQCLFSLNGNPAPSEEDIKKHRLTCDRTQTLRNYYLYLWGLPMKLQDPGTILSKEVRKTDFFGRPCYVLQVTYDPEVGKDVWYFYFDTTSFSLAGYRFYHDETQNDGEYIILKEEEQLNGIRLPKIRQWYTNKDGEFLGEDRLNPDGNN